MGLAAVLFGDDMIDFKREEGDIGMEQAVFTTVSGAFDSLLPQGSRDGSDTHRELAR